ncbi:MAG TPA: DUF1343 domain-containing protein [bacterium]|nr:DUF1343 domain-containing protein [bacterium]
MTFLAKLIVGVALFAIGTANVYAVTVVEPKVKLGVENFCEDGPPGGLVGAKFGLLTNQSGLDSQFRSTIDLLHQRKDMKLVILFGPEHGIRGDRFDARHEDEMVDDKTGIKVYSVFGSSRSKFEERLEGLDALIYDIQDVGSRGYTYVSSMIDAMEKCARKKVKFLVFDRPNPLGGNRVEGNVLEKELISFVGCAEMPYVYGLTPGELATWIKAERKIDVDLTVIPLKGWRRDMTWEETGLPWIPTSPHVPHPSVCYHMVVTGVLGELHAVNEGVGTAAPFEYMGAPWIDSVKLADYLNAAEIPGFYFRPASFIPRYHSYKEEQCQGVQIHLVNMKTANTWQANLALMTALHKLYPEKKIFEGELAPQRIDMFEKVCGTRRIRADILAGKSAKEIDAQFDADRQAWIGKVAPFIIYKEGNETFKVE